MDTLDGQLLEKFRIEYTDSMRRIIEANADLQERIRCMPVHAEYDSEDDTLIVYIGENQEALSPSIENELFLRVDPDTLKIVGAELLHFRDHMRDRSDLLNVVLHLLALAGTASLTVRVADAGDERADPVSDMRKLLAV